MIMRSMFPYFFQKIGFWEDVPENCVSKAHGGTKLGVRVMGDQISTF